MWETTDNVSDFEPRLTISEIEMLLDYSKVSNRSRARYLKDMARYLEVRNTPELQQERKNFTIQAELNRLAR
jgi:hypothetical protein